ncbi:hypothetical protein YPPY103_1012 [Yersinia pestis PY-103]|nr:hypothetical protein YPPY103_1012 [Yersinia pestis PY-103]
MLVSPLPVLLIEAPEYSTLISLTILILVVAIPLRESL